MLLDIEIQDRHGIAVIDSKLLHKKLGVRSYHADWIRRRIENYGFENGKDYWKCDYSKLSNHKKTNGGDRKSKIYLLTLDMAKELCMLENNEIGKETRRYFIKAEKQLRQYEIARLATKEARKTITDAIKESGENERMHGHGYSTYTNLVYELAGLKTEFVQFKAENKNSNFRDELAPEDLKRVSEIEDMVKSLVNLNKEYSEIKEFLEPMFNSKKE